MCLSGSPLLKTNDCDRFPGQRPLRFRRDSTSASQPDKIFASPEFVPCLAGQPVHWAAAGFCFSNASTASSVKPLADGALKLPMNAITMAAMRKITKRKGMSLIVGLAAVTKLGMVPPIAKPMFQDKPVPLARMAVGKRSLRKAMSGPQRAVPRKHSTMA